MPAFAAIEPIRKTGHLEYTPGCEWCESTEDALELLGRRECGSASALGAGLAFVRRVILRVTASCGNPEIVFWRNAR